MGSAFNLNGGFVEFDMDVSNVDVGVNANLFTISPYSFASDHFNNSLDYCAHAQGCSTTNHFNGTSKFHMKIAYDETGHMTVSRDGEVFADYSPAPDDTTWVLVKSYHEGRGAVIYGSEWVGYVPVEDCGTTAGDLNNSSYSISNLVISGSVVQGPVPTKCSQPPTPPPPRRGADLYCPSVEDLTIAYGAPLLFNGGWKIEGAGGAATKSAFNLNG